MKVVIQKLIKLKNASSNFLNKHLNEILVFAVTSVAAFLFIIFLNIDNAIEKNELMKENSELMMRNLMFDYRDKQRILMLDRQRIYIRDLERFKEAILKGNYTQNENTKQNKFEMVGQRQVGDLGL